MDKMVKLLVFHFHKIFYANIEKQGFKFAHSAFATVPLKPYLAQCKAYRTCMLAVYRTGSLFFPFLM